MNKLITITLVLFIILIGKTSLLNGKEETKPQWKWTIDDFLTAERINEYKISPDGKKLAWTINKWNLKEQKQYNVLYLTHLPTNKTKVIEKTRLTYSEDKYNSLRWIPGENKISFKTSRRFKDIKENNLWVINLDGGEPYPLTFFEYGVGQVEWIDKDNFLFIGREAKTLHEKNSEEQKDTTEVVEDEIHRVIARLFTYNLPKKQVKRLTENVKPIRYFSLSPDKKWAVYTVNMSLKAMVDFKIRDKYYLLNFASGQSREIFTEPIWNPLIFNWAMDSSGFYVELATSTQSKYSILTPLVKIYWYPLDTGKYKEIDLQWERYANDQWDTSTNKSATKTTLDGVLISLLNGVHYKYARYYKKGQTWQRQWIKGNIQKNIFSLQLSEDGKTMIYEYSTASQPPRYYLAELRGDEFIKKAEVMKTESSLFNKPLAKSEIISWEGARGDIVEGILYYPYKYKEGEKYPLIVMIHGGPYAADMDFFSTSFVRPIHQLAERGAFVLKINYHGSSNYGLEFGESIIGHYYEYEIPDIETGVDKLIAEGKADKGRIGVMGWSNGAILGIQLTIHTSRYKVASFGAGGVNWTSDYGTCWVGASMDNYYFGGPPWEKIETYIAKSPIFHLTEVTTPTLIFHGELDRNVPYGQGWEYYRALQQIGKAPVRFISFPDEGHDLKSLAHQRRKLIEEISWFEKYLFNTLKEKNEALKKDSPLEQLDINLKIAKVNGSYGEEKYKLLIPETVEYNKLNVGRYEVTQAQWAAYDTNYKLEKGSENYPVTSVTFKQALEYIRWLNKKTGETYRLPRKDEIRNLYEKRSGNTFDYWAGCTLNFDDYINLLEEIEKYGDKPVLLKPVGSFPPSGENPVFDLDGNAAEWVQLEEGKAKACGGSAERPIDTQSVIEPMPHYIGFRVIKIKKQD